VLGGLSGAGHSAAVLGPWGLADHSRLWLARLSRLLAGGVGPSAGRSWAGLVGTDGRMAGIRGAVTACAAACQASQIQVRPRRASAGGEASAVSVVSPASSAALMVYLAWRVDPWRR
jgi:hypothetical protein